MGTNNSKIQWGFFIEWMALLLVVFLPTACTGPDGGSSPAIRSGNVHGGAPISTADRPKVGIPQPPAQSTEGSSGLHNGSGATSSQTADALSSSSHPRDTAINNGNDGIPSGPKHPVLPDEFIGGVCHTHVHRRGHGYGSAASAREIDSLKALGVNWIALTPFGYQESADADRILGVPGRDSSYTDPTMTEMDLAAETTHAHANGLKVMLKLQLWSHDFMDGTEWHGTIRQATPRAHRQWWTCYRELALHYAGVAERAGADLYCIGTELVQMTTRYPEEWRTLVADIRKIYSGPITYAAHWDREFRSIEFWDALDAVGVNAYFPLQAPDSADAGQLTEAWAPHRKALGTIADRTSRPIIFTELGYRPVAGHYRTPWTYHGGTPDPSAQSRAYESFFRAFDGLPWFRGVFFWKTFTDRTIRREGFSFRGTETEHVLRSWLR